MGVLSIKKIFEYLKRKAIEAADRIIVDWFKYLYWFLLGGIAFLTIAGLLVFLPEPPIKLPSEPYKVSNEWKVYPQVSYDNQGRFVHFQFAALSNDYVWKKGRSDILSYNGRELSPKIFKEKVLAGLKGLIKASSGLVAVGSSSQEGDLKTEQQRAEKRGDTLSNWLLPIVTNKKGLYRLNIGQYQGEVGNLAGIRSAYQRPAIIVCIINWDEDVDMKQALLYAMKKQRDLPNPDSYSVFDVDLIRPMPKKPSGFVIWVRSMVKEAYNSIVKIF